MSIQQTDTEQKSVYFSIVKIAAHCASNCLRSYRKGTRLEKKNLILVVYSTVQINLLEMGLFTSRLISLMLEMSLHLSILTKRNEATI